MERTGYETGARNSRAGGGFGGVPVLVALAFLMAVTLDLSGPGVTASGRDGGHARAVARPLSEALARAVRGMVGVQSQRPLARGRAASLAGVDPRAESAIGPAGSAGGAGHHVRVGLLNLPPPALLA